MTGINSGMDTQSIVEQLVTAKSKKKETLEKTKTKVGWKQEAWKTLNSKLYSLYNEQFGTLRLQSAFKAKSASIVDSSIASVTADNNAVNGTQTLAVKQLSKTAYITGKKLETDAEGNETTVKSSSKLSDIVGTDYFTDTVDEASGLKATAFKVYANKSDTKGTNVVITSDMTMADVASAFSNAGLNASFDTNTNRFFISSKSDGGDGNFRITQATDNAEDLLRRAEGYTSDSDKANMAFNLLNSLGITQQAAGDAFIEGENAIIELNGAEFESNTNLFNVNGLNITATQVSEIGSDGEYITTNVSTSTDVDGIYDMIKNFITKYNEIINEMDKLYNADSAKDYEPLTAEEKESMSEDEVEEWETKIKDSLLRRDDNLGTLISTLKNGMSSSFTASSGNKYSLASFGINTLSYFEAADNEKGAYHIDGDADDDKTKGETDLLKAALTDNLEDTTEFFNSLAKGIYDSFGKLMTRSDYRSFQSLYDDKALQDEYDQITDDIEDEEEYLSEFEDKWYDKFAAMEAAMEKVNAKSNAIAGLFQ